MLDFGTGSVRGRLAVPAADMVVECSSGDPRASALTCQASVRPAADGSFEFPRVLAGPMRVGRMLVKPDGGTQGPLAEVRVEVPAGGTAEAVVP